MRTCLIRDILFFAYICMTLIFEGRRLRGTALPEHSFPSFLLLYDLK